MQKLLKNLDALLITNQTNVRYLTGFVGMAENEREAYCLVTASGIYLITSPLYAEYAKNLVLHTKRGSNYPIIQLSNKPINKTLTKLIASNSVKKLGFEENNLIVAEYGKLTKELPGITLVPTQNKVEDLRIIKQDNEIDNIRQAAKLTDECFDFILEKLKTCLPAGRQGVTEQEIAWEIESFIRKNGAQLAFSPIVAFGENTSQPHYNPNFTRPRLEIEAPQGEALKDQDIILLDFGSRVNGYCSDMTRVVFIGQPKDEWRRAFQTVLAAQQTALNRLSHMAYEKNPDGARGLALDRMARGKIEQAGFPDYPHSLGHGVGLDIHEAPRLTMKKDVQLKPGMVVTIEPGVYIEGQYGVRLEDLVLLKEDCVEVLSRSTKDVVIL